MFLDLWKKTGLAKMMIGIFFAFASIFFFKIVMSHRFKKFICLKDEVFFSQNYNK